jgi:Tol biopolymer transport system component
MAVGTLGDRNIWVHDLSRGTLTRLTTEGRNARAIWTPDGTRLTYESATAGNANLFWRPADPNGPAERLTKSSSSHSASSWSPDGRELAFVEFSPTTGFDIWVLSIPDGQPRALVQTRFNEAYPEFSPDGRWLAFASDESGRTEVYVQPYPGPGPRQQVSTAGGTAPAWSRDGRELFYEIVQPALGNALIKMMAVAITLRPGFAAGAPHMLFEGRYAQAANIRGYDVTPDGRRFLMVQDKERPATAAAEMILVQNWIEELKARVPTR